MAVRRDAIMLTLLFSYGLLAIWRSLGLLSRAFCVVFPLASMYCLFSATKAMLRIHSWCKVNPARDLASIQLAVAGVRDGMAKARQVTDAAFYLFGIVLFSNLQTIGNVADHSKIPVDYHIFQNFLFHCSLAESAFVVFLVLHLIEWCVIGRANACSERLKAQGS